MSVGTHLGVNRMNDDEWRNPGSSLQSLVREMFLKDIGTDVTIHFGSAEDGDDASHDFNCHALVLLASSPFFEAMLHRDTTGYVGGHKRLCFPYDDPVTFKIFVTMMYCDWNCITGSVYGPLNLNMSQPEKIVDVLLMADKYLSTSMVNACKRVIYQFVTEKGTTDIGIRFYSRLKELPHCGYGQVARDTLRKVENFLFQDGESIFCSNAIEKFSRENLFDIVASDSLKCNEDTVYDGCRRWAIRQCLDRNLPIKGKNLRFVLGDIIEKIRYPLMEWSYFITDVAEHQIFNVDERLEYACFRPDSKRYRRRKNSTFEMKRLDFDNKSDHLEDFSKSHGFQILGSKALHFSAITFGFFAGENQNYIADIIVAADDQEISTTGFSAVRCTKYPNIFLVQIKGDLDIPAFTPINIYFRIEGSTYVAREVVPQASNEIGVWVDGSIIEIQVRAIPEHPNGLRQLPLILFTAHKTVRPRIPWKYMVYHTGKSVHKMVRQKLKEETAAEKATTQALQAANTSTSAIQAAKAHPAAVQAAKARPAAVQAAIELLSSLPAPNALSPRVPSTHALVARVATTNALEGYQVLGTRVPGEYTVSLSIPFTYELESGVPAAFTLESRVQARNSRAPKAAGNSVSKFDEENCNFNDSDPEDIESEKSDSEDEYHCHNALPRPDIPYDINAPPPRLIQQMLHSYSPFYG